MEPFTSGIRSEKGFGESGIRTHGRVSPTHAFQACSFNHSDISPLRVNDLRTVSDQIIARHRRMHASSTSPLNPAVYGPPTAARAWELCQTSKSLEITYGRRSARGRCGLVRARLGSRKGTCRFTTV